MSNLKNIFLTGVKYFILAWAVILAIIIAFYILASTVIGVGYTLKVILKLIQGLSIIMEELIPVVTYYGIGYILGMVFLGWLIFENWGDFSYAQLF